LAITLGLHLAQLIIADPTEAIAKIKALLETYGDRLDDPPIRRFFDFVGPILIYKQPHLTREEIQAMLHLPHVDLTMVRIVLEAWIKILAFIARINSNSKVLPTWIK